MEKQIERLKKGIVQIKDMVHVALPTKNNDVNTAMALSIGEWVEVCHDYSKGHSSAGGVAIITKVDGNVCEVKYVVDGCQEKFVELRRLTAIPMPYKGDKVELRPRRPQMESAKDVCSSLQSVWSKMNPVQCLKYGKEKKLDTKEGWLWKILLKEGLVANAKEGKRARVWGDYQAQQLYIQAQKDVMPEDWDPLRPSSSQNRLSGKFQSSSKRQNPIPSNILTATYLRWAHGTSKETFRRWKQAATGEYDIKILHNKGTTVFESSELAQQYYSAKRLYVSDMMKKFNKTPRGTLSNAEDKSKYRDTMKGKYMSLPEEQNAAWEKLSRDKCSLRKNVKEGIIQTLRDNNQQSFKSIAEVTWQHMFSYMSKIT